MTNKEIAKKFNQLAKIMELHGENPFKIRSYSNAYVTLRKIEKPLVEMSHDELSEIKGVGKAIADKIQELAESGDLATYRKYADQTPPGIIEMLGVRGFGPKKIKVVWKEMEIETIGELLYACNENRLVELKGFGIKTQDQLKKQLQYFIDSQGKYLYGYIIDEAEALVSRLQETLPEDEHAVTGALRRLMPIVDGIEIVTTTDRASLVTRSEELGLNMEDGWKIDSYPVEFIFTDKTNWGSSLLKSSSPDNFVQQMDLIEAATEKEIFQHAGLAFVAPEYRDMEDALELSQEDLSKVIDYSDLRGVIHSHSTDSDGIHTIAEMSEYAQSLGYEYLVNTDHSRAAFYANGLTEERVWEQFENIDTLNKANPDFRIYKGIEADILNDGSMDYGNDFIQNFEVVIASIHSNLKMDKEKATNRLIKAIENPHVHMLGHPTGRLLLSREGYPIDHMKVIDACADNGVVLELNANPLRLDLDWTWIPYALEKGIMISINPDSHNRESIPYMRFGVNVARKALLPKGMCLNARKAPEFQKWVDSLK